MLKHSKRILALLGATAALALVWGGLTLAKPPKPPQPPPLDPPQPASGVIYYWDQYEWGQDFPYGDRGSVYKITLLEGNVTSVTLLTNSGLNNAKDFSEWDVSHGNSPRFFIYSADDPEHGRRLYVSVEEPDDFRWQQRLDGSDGYHWHVAISPDDSKIAVTADEGGLWVARLVYDPNHPGLPTGISEPVFVANTSANVFMRPTWSPDGKYIAYGPTHFTLGFTKDIFVVSLVFDADGNVTGGTTPLNITNTPDVWELQPAWSPTGRIAFSVEPKKRFGPDKIYTVDSDGRNRVLAVAKVNSGAAKNALPAWSPEGQQVAFAAGTNRGERAVMYSSHDGSTTAANLTGFAAERVLRRIHWRD